jgi:hypothetical protein
MKNVKSFEISACDAEDYRFLYKILLDFQIKNKIDTFNPYKSPKICQQKIADYINFLGNYGYSHVVKDGKDTVAFMCYITDARDRVIADFGIKNPEYRFGSWLSKAMEESLRLAKEHYKTKKIYIVPEKRSKFSSYIKFFGRMKFLQKRDRLNKKYFVYS